MLNYVNWKLKDRKRHEILGFIIEPILQHYGNGNSIKARSFEEIEKKFNLSKTEIWEISTELIENKEIIYYVDKFNGFLGTDNGINSFSNYKYIKRSNNEIRESIKYYIVLLTFIITTLNLFKNCAIQKENNIIMDKINKLSNK